MDDILDLIEDAALRTLLYEVSSFPSDFHDLAETLCKAVGSLVLAVPLLSNMKHHLEIHRLCEEINTCENTGDDIYQNALAHLFHEQKDPIELIKLKEILGDIEEALDKCEQVANIIGGVVIKYA